MLKGENVAIKALIAFLSSFFVFPTVSAQHSNQYIQLRAYTQIFRLQYYSARLLYWGLS
jgi:hypothetical protein